MRYIITLALASAPAFAEVPRVVTDIPPVHSLVAQVMGTLGQPELLLTKGADEHDFQLRPSQASAVADAGLVVWIGPELTPWLASALKNRAEGGAALALLDAEGTEVQAYGDEAKVHDHADHADHAGDDTSIDHAHGGADPHAWLDPANGRHWLGLIAGQLARLDPENAAIYAANAAAAAARIEALDADLALRLAPVRNRPFVTFHDAYGYFTAHYGLAYSGSVALGDASSPGAQRLSDLRGRLEAGTVPCIFPEVQHAPDLVLQMAEGTGAKVGGALDPVGSALEPGPEAYAQLLSGIAQTLIDCTGG